MVTRLIWRNFCRPNKATTPYTEWLPEEKRDGKFQYGYNWYNQLPFQYTLSASQLFHAILPIGGEPMLGNFAYLPSNYRLFYGAFLFALIGNMLFIFIKHPAWTFSLPTVIVLFLINVFFWTKYTKKLIPCATDALFYVLLFLLVFHNH